MIVPFIIISVTLSEEDDRDFEKAVSKFPSSYDLKITPLTKPKLESIRDKLLGKLSNGFVLLEEELQVYNLISYLSFRLGKADIAFDFNKKVLQKDKSNGIALANRARFNRNLLYFSDAEDDVNQLERLYAIDNAAVTIKVLAEGELAYSYARFGPKFHELAISKYESIFKAAPVVRKDVLILWKYDYCLCLRRTLHLFTIPEHPDRDSIKTIRTACEVLSEIIDISDLQVYTARAWTELGQLTYNVEKMPESLGLDILECIPAQKRCDKSKNYFDRAIELGNNDFDVLEVCAKFYRYYNRLKLAVSLFEEALKRRQTSAGYHHLALSVKKLELGRICLRKNSRKKRKKATQAVATQTVAEVKGIPTLHEKEQNNFAKLIKCRRDEPRMVENERTMQIMVYLEKAVELSPFNHPAVYDKALFLRQLQRTEDARRLFCRLIKGIDIGEMKISCYEQAGYCCLDMAEASMGENTKGTERNLKDYKKYNIDAICYFQRAIEVAATLAAKVK